MPLHSPSDATFADRLRFILKEKGVSQSELAKTIGVSRQTISYLCKSNATWSKFTFEIASALNIRFEWLQEGIGPIYDTSTTPNTNATQREASLLEEQTSNTWVTEIEVKSACMARQLDNTLPSKFSFVLNDKSMWPRFDKGTELVVNRQRQAKSGDYVLAYVSEDNEVIVRILDLENKLLQPFYHEQFKTKSIQQNDTIVGVITEARWRTSTDD